MSKTSAIERHKMSVSYFNRYVQGIILVSALLLCSLTLNGDSHAAFFGEVKTGLQNIAIDRYGYSLYVPVDYTPQRVWPLVIALHDEGEKGEDYIQTWVQEAKKRGMILFCPTYPAPRDVPFDNDKRILRLKQLIQSQYEVNPKKVLLTGSGFGGHYAFYLGLRYPSQFTAVASVGNGVEGRFAKLFSMSYAKAHRLPFAMLTTVTDHSADSEANGALNAIRARGYKVDIVKAGELKDLNSPEVSAYILDWFDQASEVYEKEAALEKRSFSVKERLLEWVDQFLQNR